MKAVVVALACLMCAQQVGAQALRQPSSEAPSATDTNTSIGRAAASDGPPSVFRSGVDLVPLNVIVTDARDKFVTGLKQEEFAVYEDGVQQQLSFFAVADVPLDLAILLDVSASMSDKLPTVQQAAIGFASHLREVDRVMVVGINDSARTLHPLDGNLEGANEAIRRATTGGSTALYNAVYTTIKHLQKVQTQDGDLRRQAIAVLTDGDDTASLVTFDDLLALAKQAGIAIYTIGLKSPYVPLTRSAKHFSESDYALKTLAMETGARSFFPTDIAQIAGIYGLITEELANQYALGYTSTNPRRDGAYRRISVRVATPNVRTRTRSGYQAVTQQAQASSKP